MNCYGSGIPRDCVPEDKTRSLPGSRNRSVEMTPPTERSTLATRLAESTAAPLLACEEPRQVIAIALVLCAEVLDEIGVGSQARRQDDRQRLDEGVRIVEGHFDVHVTVIAA